MSIVKIKVLHKKFGETFTHEKKGYGLVIVIWWKQCVPFIFLDSAKSSWQFIFTENLSSRLPFLTIPSCNIIRFKIQCIHL